jgi:hypothetical protein
MWRAWSRKASLAADASSTSAAFCWVTASGQVANLVGHHRKAASLLARARRFDRRVEREDIGLERDAVDHADDVGDLAGRSVDRFHGVKWGQSRIVQQLSLVAD